MGFVSLFQGSVKVFVGFERAWFSHGLESVSRGLYQGFKGVLQGALSLLLSFALVLNGSTRVGVAVAVSAVVAVAAAGGGGGRSQ